MSVHLLAECTSTCIPLLFQAYNFHGETLLAEDKCGLAIKCLQESKARKNTLC